MQDFFIKCDSCKKTFKIGCFPVGSVISVKKGKCPRCNYVNEKSFGIITPFTNRIFNLLPDSDHPQIASSTIRKKIFSLNKTEEQQAVLKELPKGSKPAPYNLILLATKTWLAQNGIESGTASIGPGHSVYFLESKLCIPTIQRNLAFWYEEHDVIKTKIRFDLSFALSVPDGRYSFRLPDGKYASLEIRFRPPEYHRMGIIPESTGASFPQPINAFALEETPENMRVSRVESLSGRALLGFSSVLLTIPQFIDTFDTPQIPSTLKSEFPEPVDPLFIYQMPPEFRVAAGHTNNFIDHLRSASGRYEIDKLCPGDIEAVTISTWGGKFLLMNIPLRGGGPFKIATEPIKEPEWLSTFEEQLKNDEAPDLIKVLILDAKKFVLQEQLRLAVININAALEMFVNNHVYTRGQPSANIDEIEKFMDGESIYEICRNQLLRESNKENQIYQEIADKLPLLEVDSKSKKKPSVYQIVNFMHNLVSFGISRAKLDQVINNIRVYRNEVAHGIVKDSDIDPNKVGNAVNELEAFMRMAVETNNKKSITNGST